MPVILIVDDEPLQRDILKTILDSEGYETHTAASGKEALTILETIHPDVILSDLRMEGMDGIELLEAIPRKPFEPSIIIITAHGTISSAVEAVKKGAFDYLTKPLDKDTLLLNVRRAIERATLLKENIQLQRELFRKFNIEGIIGRSAKMQTTVDIMKRVSPSSVTVLITGESGTGKELVARALHYNSPRRAKPFIAINCAAIPDNLFESELFGYEAGAFTGAVSRKEGLFKTADGGTLFLDEIGDLSLPMQSKLLRVLQDREVRRVGGKDAIKVDVRVIAATNKALEKELNEGRFREDLYYRLKVVSINLPPLKERIEDIPELSAFFVNKYSREFGRRIKGIDTAALKMLCEYHWPGNIRQLETVIERAVLMNDKDRITAEDIKNDLWSRQCKTSFDLDIPDEGIDFEDLEKELMKKALAKANGNASKAAKLLGMSYKTFLYRLEKFHLNGHSKKTE
jgi:two-component system response regulator AtoC